MSASEAEDCVGCFVRCARGKLCTEETIERGDSSAFAVGFGECGDVWFLATVRTPIAVGCFRFTVPRVRIGSGEESHAFRASVCQVIENEQSLCPIMRREFNELAGSRRILTDRNERYIALREHSENWVIFKWFRDDICIGCCSAERCSGPCRIVDEHHAVSVFHSRQRCRTRELQEVVDADRQKRVETVQRSDD